MKETLLPGDIALIIQCPYFPENIGVFVTVLQQVAPTIELKEVLRANRMLGDKLYKCKPINTTLTGKFINQDRKINHAEEMIIPNSYLAWM